jgi:hypothetical protein
MLKFMNLKISYKFRILNVILNSLVCNMIKVFTRPTSASDFLIANFHVLGIFTVCFLFIFMNLEALLHMKSYETVRLLPTVNSLF